MSKEILAVHYKDQKRIVLLDPPKVCHCRPEDETWETVYEDENRSFATVFEGLSAFRREVNDCIDGGNILSVSFQGKEFMYVYTVSQSVYNNESKCRESVNEIRVSRFDEGREIWMNKFTGHFVLGCIGSGMAFDGVLSEALSVFRKEINGYLGGLTECFQMQMELKVKETIDEIKAEKRRKRNVD